ncbi:MAG: methionine synthase, partial [Candidatus Omnitrophica bacterium]|nr:methionine synthase [Candidatus Omnitrophota bacterium]
SEGLGKLYETYISEDYDAFALTKEHAEGFYAFLDAAKKIDPECVKGHITGPISFGLGVCDEKGKAIIYNETLKEALIKVLEIKAAWQIDKLKTICKNVIIFIDEPYLTSFGSSFISIERSDVIPALDSVVDKIHSKGALAGIHCCGNTDWSLLTETAADIINFDAYSYAEGLALYPDDIKGFLKKGGTLAWGIVPTSDAVLKESESSLLSRLSQEIKNLENKGIPRKLLIDNSLLTPSCGMGTLSEELTGDIIKKLTGLARLAKDNLS